jgi:uncharacterized membrane protein YgcG
MSGRASTSVSSRVPARAPAVRARLARVAVIAFALFALVAHAPARAAEQISAFDVLIEVERSGQIVVTETLDVVAEGNQIQRGIFRDLPRYFERNGQRYQYGYRVLSVRRDGREEPYETSADGNAYRIRIGDPDAFLTHGPHRYELRYRVSNQVRYFDSHDEIYWNATGNYWAFPILRARATVALPPGATVVSVAGYTGAMGQAGTAYIYRQNGERHLFEITRTLQPGEGLTVAVGFEKGLIDPPSPFDEGALLWQRYGALGILIASLAGLFLFLYRSWDRVGRDPSKGPVFPRYEAPRGYSPAAVHHIYHRGVSGHRALIATLMHLAVKGRINIDASDKKRTQLKLTAPISETAAVAAEDLALERSIFRGGETKTLGQQVDTAFTSAYTSFRAALGRKYGSAYFRWNVGYTLAALALTVLAVVLAANAAVTWTVWHTIGVLALAALNLAFMYFMPAPTPKGQTVRTEIEGFKLYLEKAEQLQLNAVEPGASAPPPMTTERYERFLPYAVALGVEAPWTRHFERLIPEEAARYSPRWSSGQFSGSRSLGAISGALVANMSSGVSSAMPQSSGSSGSGGGGSSGGGGGGGGGGGW